MVKSMPASAGDTRDTGQSLGQESPLEKAVAPTPVLLPGKSHGRRSLAGYCPWGHEESDMTEQQEWRSKGLTGRTIS